MMKLSEWQGAAGWYCGDMSDLSNGSNRWWLLPRTLNIPLEKFVADLVNVYHAKIYYNNSYLSYWWDKQSDMRKYKNQMNSALRKI